MLEEWQVMHTERGQDAGEIERLRVVLQYDEYL